MQVPETIFRYVLSAGGASKTRLDYRGWGNWTNEVGGTEMSSPMVPARTSTGRLNQLAVVSRGAGHVALNQIPLRGEQGRGIAIAALVIGYGIAALA